MKKALVRFRDKRKQKYLVLTKDIKGFNPSSAEDFQNREYLVKWQDSFHDDLSDTHVDGCYPADILLVGGL